MAKPNANLMTQTAKQKLGQGAGSAANKYVEKACKSICGAIGTWQPLAMFSGLKINSVTALGRPGCLKGPSLQPFIVSTLPLGNDWERKMSKAVSEGVSQAWDDYVRSVTVPGLPWYPSFAAVPAPQAAPMPNVPTPFAALPRQSPSTLSRNVRNNVKGKAGSISNAAAIAEAIAAGLAAVIPLWAAGVVIRNVLGKGPVPSFAPPYVPVGPVVAGDNIATPGHLGA